MPALKGRPTLKCRYATESGGLGELALVAKEASAVQVDVGQVKRHRATLGDLLGFIQADAGQVMFAADEVVWAAASRPITSDRIE